MFRLCVIGALACVLVGIPACAKRSLDTEGGVQNESAPEYSRANHGFNSGLTEMVDLSAVDGFDDVRTMDDLARFASEVPGAVGFTAHPHFESGTRYASAVVWYTNLSSTSSSWALYLFDRAEAQKNPGDAPRAAAVAAAETKLSSRMKTAQDLIDAGGPDGVKLVGDRDEQNVLARAIMRLGGSFQHTGTFGVAHCRGCRTVVPGGTPSLCGHGVQGTEHWNCCGSTEKIGHCHYWELLVAQEESRQGKAGDLPEDTE